MNKKLLIFGIIALVLVMGAVLYFTNENTVSKPEFTKVTLVLDWLPQGFHVPLFLAQELGYFADEGLDVEFRIPADPTTVLQTVAAGTDDFGLNYPADILVARSKGAPVVSVMAIVQHPLVVFGTLKSSGITEPRALTGKKVALPVTTANASILETMLKNQGKTSKDVEVVDVGYDVVAPL